MSFSKVFVTAIRQLAERQFVHFNLVVSNLEIASPPNGGSQ